MTKAVWRDSVLAQSNDVLLVEFAIYFPFDSIAPDVLRDSSVASTYCHWKGEAKYFDIVVGDHVNEGAAWCYEKTYEDAAVLAGRIAFWKGVEFEGKPACEPLMDPGGARGNRTGYEALCWLLVRSTETVLSADQIEQKAGLRGQSLTRAFEHRHAKPFIQRYKWRLDNGSLHRG